MYLLILSLVTVLAVSGAKNVAKRNVACDRISNCLYEVEAHRIADLPFLRIFYGSSEVTEVNSTIFDEEFHTQLCQGNAVFQSCLTENKVECGNFYVISAVSSYAEFLQHLCSDQGREELQSIANSSCVTDQAEEASYGLAVFECIRNTFSQIELSSDVCPLLDQLETCIQTTLTERCGEDFSTYGMNLFDIYLNDTDLHDLGINCDQQARQIRHLQPMSAFPRLFGTKQRRELLTS